MQYRKKIKLVMEEKVSDSEGECEPVTIKSESKKRKIYGRMREVMKKVRLQSHEVGENCNCKKKCFENVPEQARNAIIKNFNALSSHDEKNSYLCSLISVLPVRRRRPRNDEEQANLRSASFGYRVRAKIGNSVKEVEVCRNAFMSLHGIKKKKVAYLQNSLKLTAMPPRDKRGENKNHPRKFKPEVSSAIYDHIKAFKGRKSHYSMKDSKRIYLPEELNINKMFKMFAESHPEMKVSYESYRRIFNTKFNISFGYPRTDTCSTCDEFLVKIKCLETDVLKRENANEKDALQKEIKRLTVENELHKRKAEVFYNRKRTAKKSSKVSATEEAICLDFGKNLCVPNITTNDVYFKSQLNVYAFNIHTLSTAQSVFYIYPETVGKKGSDDVCSLLHHFLYNFLDPNVKHLTIFCDSCAGQNKNFTMFRFLHNVVHNQKRLDNVKVVFPIRGHSYMEPDKNMGLVNTAQKAEIPADWVDIFRDARAKPSPFEVVEVEQALFRSWTKFFESNAGYLKKCPFPTRAIRELEIRQGHPRVIFYRNSYNGMWESGIVKNKEKKSKLVLLQNEFVLPQNLYTGKMFYCMTKKVLR